MLYLWTAPQFERVIPALGIGVATLAIVRSAEAPSKMAGSHDQFRRCRPALKKGRTLNSADAAIGLKRSPSKKLTGTNKEDETLALLLRWRDEAIQSGQEIKRIAVAFEFGRDGFWLARWLRAQGIEAYVIHAASTAVSREHRRAKTDRLDIELLQRGFLGWLRGEVGHCKMVAIPSREEEDSKRPGRERETLVSQCTRIVNGMKSDLARLGVRNFNPKLKKAPAKLDAVRTPEGEASPDIAEYVANAVRFDQAIALRGIGKSRTHFRFAGQALPNKRPEGLCHAASCPAAPAWRTVGARLASPAALSRQGKLRVNWYVMPSPFSFRFRPRVFFSVSPFLWWEK